MDTLKTKLRKRQSPKIVIIDNITVYVSELKNGQLYTLKEEFPNITFIFMAHEDKNEPYTSTAKLCKKLAKVIIRVVGLTAFVSGRCPGGQIVVDEQTAMYITEVKSKTTNTMNAILVNLNISQEEYEIKILDIYLRWCMDFAINYENDLQKIVQNAPVFNYFKTGVF